MGVKRCIKGRWVGPRVMEAKCCFNDFVDIQEHLSEQCIHPSVLSRGTGSQSGNRDSIVPRLLPRRSFPAVERKLERRFYVSSL